MKRAPFLLVATALSALFPQPASAVSAACTQLSASSFFTFGTGVIIPGEVAYATGPFIAGDDFSIAVVAITLPSGPDPSDTVSLVDATGKTLVAPIAIGKAGGRGVLNYAVTTTLNFVGVENQGPNIVYINSVSCGLPPPTPVPANGNASLFVTLAFVVLLGLLSLPNYSLKRTAAERLP